MNLAGNNCDCNLAVISKWFQRQKKKKHEHGISNVKVIGSFPSEFLNQ